MADRMNVIYILDQDENIRATLQAGEPGVDESPLACPYYDAVFTDGIDGEERLEFTVPMKTPDGSPIKDAAEIVENGYCIIQDINNAYRMFEIVEIEDTDTKGYIKQVVAISAAAKELDDDPRIEAEPRPTTASSAMEIALAQSRWKVGIVELTHTGHVHFYRESPLSCLKKIVEEWGGELRFRVRISGNRVVERYVDLLARHGGNYGKRFEYSKDLKEVVRETFSEGVKTAMYGWGKGEPTKDGGYGRRLTFADVEWKKSNGDPVDKPLGQTWVGDPEALSRVGRAGFTRHRFGDVTFEDIEDPVELLQKTWEYLQTVNVPKVQYRVKAVDLYRLLGPDRAGHELVQKGDDVAILDREFNPELLVEARVLTIRWDLKNPENTEYIIGNYITYSTDFQEWVGRELRERVVRVNDPITWTLTEFKQEASEKWDNRPGYFHLSQERGILVTDSPVLEQSTSAVGLRAGMLALADSWDANANDFDWNTFIDGTSVNADFINTGTLNASLVQIYSAAPDSGTTREITLFNGYVSSYFDGQKTIEMGGSNLYLWPYLPGSGGTGEDEAGVIYGVRWYDDPVTDGVAISGRHFVGLALMRPDKTGEPILVADKNLKSTTLAGPASASSSDLTMLALRADSRLVAEGGRQPGIWLGRGDIDSTAVANVEVYVGDGSRSNAPGEFAVYQNLSNTSGALLALFEKQAHYIPLQNTDDSRLFLDAESRIERSSTHFRIMAGQGYISIRKSDGRLAIVQGGTETHAFDPDGTKKGGSIEIDGTRWGMSPIDSPRVLISDLIMGVDVTEEGTIVELDERLGKAMAAYTVFANRPVEISNIGQFNFKVSGAPGKVDLFILGIRIDYADQYFEKMSVDEELPPEPVEPPAPALPPAPNEGGESMMRMAAAETADPRMPRFSGEMAPGEVIKKRRAQNGEETGGTSSEGN